MTFLETKNLPKIVKFKKSYLKNVDIIFTALPNGEAQDISQAFAKKKYINRFICGF